MYKLTEKRKREFCSVICKYLLHLQKRPMAMIFHDESRSKIIPFELVCRIHRACTGF